MILACLDCGYVLNDPLEIISEMMIDIDGRRWCACCGSNNVLDDSERSTTMAELPNLKVNVTIDVAKEIAREKGVTVREALNAMVNVMVQELVATVKDLSAGRPDDPRIEDLQKGVRDARAQVAQAKEWISAVRPGIDAHEGKIETLMDTVQSLVSSLNEHAQAIVALRQHLGISE